jgi:hypothetical protein
MKVTGRASEAIGAKLLGPRQHFGDSKLHSPHTNLFGKDHREVSRTKHGLDVLGSEVDVLIVYRRRFVHLALVRAQSFQAIMES